MAVTKTSKYKYAKVLLVDDNKLDLHISKQVLLSNNFTNQLLTYSDGREAIAYLQEVADQNNIEPSDVPSVILLDLYMPHMNGFEFLEAFESLPSVIRENCKVIVLSTSEKKEDKEKVRKNKNVTRFISKPLQPQNLEHL